MAELSEADRQELSIRGHIRAFMIGGVTGLSVGIISCGYIYEGAIIGLVAGVLGYISKPQFQNLCNIRGLKP